MLTTLFRQAQLNVQMQTPTGQSRGFVYHVSIGFRGNINSESGMLVDLVELDSLLRQACERVSKVLYQAPGEDLMLLTRYICERVQTELSYLFESLAGELVLVQVQEFRGATICWYRHSFYLKQRQFFEALNARGQVDLVEACFVWLLPESEIHQLEGQGRALLKNLQGPLESQLEKLEALVGSVRVGSSKLAGLELKLLHRGTSIEMGFTLTQAEGLN